MERITVKRVSLASALKISTILFFAVGMVLGLAALLIGILNGGLHISVNTYEASGVAAGIMGLLFLPVVLAVTGFLLGLILYVPLTVLTATTNLIQADGRFRYEGVGPRDAAAEDLADEVAYPVTQEERDGAKF